MMRHTTMVAVPYAAISAAAGFTLALAPSPALGQAFNIDFGTQAGVPPFDTTAASDQGGVWFIPTTSANFIDTDFWFNNSGDVVPVAFASSRALDAAGNAGITGPDGLIGLIADGIVIGEPRETRPAGDPRAIETEGPVTLTFDGLVPGEYEVFTYTFSPLDFDAAVDITVNGETRSSFGLGQPPLLFYQEGLTHTRHVLNVGPGETLSIRADATSGFAMLNGLQIVPIPAPGVPAMLLLSAAGTAMTRRR